MITRTSFFEVEKHEQRIPSDDWDQFDVSVGQRATTDLCSTPGCDLLARPNASEGKCPTCRKDAKTKELLIRDGLR